MISDITSNPNIELLQPQVYENIAIIPLKTERNYIDILTLKKGLELGLVNVKECDTSQVNTIIVKNNAITPLILIDGEEIIGGDQNRIVNSTILIDAGSKMKIPVSCSEKNRWAFKSEFKQSEYMANYNTRRAKEYASRVSNSYQDVIWSSIDCLEVENDYASPTSAMEESYKNIKATQNEIIKQFKIMDGQTGVLIMVDGEIKGFELFLNSGIYRDFHEKIIKSYLIDSKIKNNMFAVNIEAAREVISHAFDCSSKKRATKELKQHTLLKMMTALEHCTFLKTI
ncbi:MAG: tubulin-like protein [Methanobrevibacter sp.]|nr:tubulin-like protein [Methanobrevibacter sp.]